MVCKNPCRFRIYLIEAIYGEVLMLCLRNSHAASQQAMDTNLRVGFSDAFRSATAFESMNLAALPNHIQSTSLAGFASRRQLQK